jgi:hypothetical protein
MTTTDNLPRAYSEPSSFASRKAAAEARGETNLPQRLVSLGWVKMPLETRSRDPKNPVRTQIVEFEQLYDLDHPMNRYRRYRNGAIEPYDYSSGREDEATSLGTFDPNHGESAARAFSAFPRDTQPTTSVPVADL